MNLELFQKRLTSFYACWKKQKRDLWGYADVLVICTPPSESHPISSLFFAWLLGHGSADTTAVFTRHHIYFLCPERKSAVLQTLAGPAVVSVNAQVTVHPKSREDDGLELLDGIIRGIRVTYAAASSDKSWSSPRPLVVGYISGESPKSNLIWGCVNDMKPKDFRSAHVTGFTRMLSHDQERSDGSELFDGSALSPEGKPEAPVESATKLLDSDEGNPPVVVRDVVMLDVADNNSTQCEEVEKSSGNDSFDSGDEEEDWELVVV